MSPLRRRLSLLVPRRRWQRVLLVVLPLLVVAWFAVPQLFVPTIRAKLQGMIASRLDARLEIRRLMYAPPFGIRARDVRLVSNASLPGWKGEVELLRVARLDLKLAHLPFKRGPLVIQNITVTDPEVHLIRTEDGRLVGMHSFVKAPQPQDEPTTRATATTHPSTQPATQPTDEMALENPEEAERAAEGAKLSDMFELRHFGIKSGRVVYEDRTSPGLPPVVWKDLDVGMETSPQSKALYGYKFDASNGDLAKINSTGSFDLDSLVVDLGNLRVEARTAYTDNQSPLPAQVQKVLRDYRVQGHVTFDAAGRFPMREPKASTYRATVNLDDASAYSPQLDASLDRLSVKLSTKTEPKPPGAAGAPDAAGAVGAGTAAPGPMRIRVEALDAASGDTTFRLDKAEVALDRGAGTWGLAEVAGRLELGTDRTVLPKQSRPALAGMDARGRVDFTLAANGLLRRGPVGEILRPEDVAFIAYPRGVTFVPPRWPAPIRDLGGGGTVRKDRGSRVVVFQDLTFNYGGDPVQMTSARVTLPPQLSGLRKQTRIEEISGTIDFRRPGPRYPGGFGKVVEALRPVGPFVVGRDSWYSVTSVEPPLVVRADPAAAGRMPPASKADYFFSVSTDSGSFTLTDKRIELLNMTGDATVSNMLVDVRRLKADVLGGKLSGAMKVTPGDATTYQGVAYVRGLNLEALSSRLILPEGPGKKLSGVGNLDAEFVVTRRREDQPILETTRAAGEFEIFRGEFWTIPVLGDIAGRVGERRGNGGGNGSGSGSGSGSGNGTANRARANDPTAKSLGTVDEAAGVFEIGDGVLTLRNAAVSSPLLGLVGSGTIGLTGDKPLDLRIVAAPLGDWRAKVKQTNVPILSDVAGEVFGAVQRLVNTATGALLYEFRVTGTVSERKVTPVPVPVLTEPAAVLFGRMLRGDDERKLLETMSGKAKPAATPASPSGEAGRR
jgi:hypothetical protein